MSDKITKETLQHMIANDPFGLLDPSKCYSTKAILERVLIDVQDAIYLFIVDPVENRYSIANCLESARNLVRQLSEEV